MENLPNHIAIVMDGNGRWANSRFLPRVAGHRKGAETAKKIINYCNDINVKILTLYTFSKENWTRPKEEINGIFGIVFDILNDEIYELHKRNIKIKIVGDVEELSTKLREKIHFVENLTKDNTGLFVNLALNYSGKWDITQATKKISKDVASNKILPDDIDENLFKKYLFLSGNIEADLLIRTSGEKRISNFLLWHLSYTELYFTDVLWPDFTEKDLDDAVSFFASRSRRFGGRKKVG